MKYRRKQIENVKVMTAMNVAYEKRNNYTDFNIESIMQLMDPKVASLKDQDSELKNVLRII